MEIHKVSDSQVEELLDYLSTHRALAQGVGLGARSKEQQDRMWEDLAQRLNAHGRGATKTGQRWKRYWISLKHKVKRRSATRKEDLHGTGGGRPKQQGSLSDTDQKVLALIGKRAVFGDSEHRIPVFIDHQPTDNEILNLPSTSASSTQASDVQQLMPSCPTEGIEHYVVDTDAQESNPQDAGVATVIEIVGELPPRSTSPSHRQLSEPPPTASQERPPKKKSKAPTKVEPSWVIELEQRRVEAEEKLAEAAYIMAQAATTHAQAANTIAQAMLVQGENISKLLNHLRNNN